MLLADNTRTRDDDQDLQAAVAAGVMAAEGEQRALLGSIVSVARAIFQAKAASIFLYDEEADELVFEAVAGEGEQSLVGRACRRVQAWRAGS